MELTLGIYEFSKNEKLKNDEPAEAAYCKITFPASEAGAKIAFACSSVRVTPNTSL